MWGTFILNGPSKPLVQDSGQTTDETRSIVAARLAEEASWKGDRQGKESLLESDPSSASSFLPEPTLSSSDPPASPESTATAEYHP